MHDSDTETDLDPADHVEPAGSRRSLLKLAAGAAAGGVAVAAATASGQAHANDPNDITLGGTKFATASTTANHTGPGAGASFLFQSGDVWVASDAGYPCALAGWSNTATRPNGVYAWTDQADGHAVVAYGEGDTNIGVLATGGRAAALLLPDGAPAPQRSDAHEVGELVEDEAGALWLCVTDGSPGAWRKIAGPTTAGALHAISPVRVYDSRIAAIPESGAILPATNRLISVKDGRDITTGAVSVTDAVPAGASAITYNLTVTDTIGSGFLFIAPGTAATLTASSINWSAPGSIVANGGTVGIDADRQVRVFCGPSGTHFLIDVTGYYL